MTFTRGARLRICALIAFAVASFAMVGSAGATSANTDATDIWWNTVKAGNGYEMINTGTFLFVVGYVYGTDRQPFWISGELRKVDAFGNTFTGPLYVNTGPHFGGPYDPATVTQRQAGTMTFVMTANSAGLLSYTVDGVAANESLQRTPLTPDDYNGSFGTVSSSISTGCLNPSNNGNFFGLIAVNIVQDGTSMTQVWTYKDNTTCTYVGTYSQLGRMGRFVANYSCNTGEVGTAELSEMNNAPKMLMARLVRHSTNLGCQHQGNIAGATNQTGLINQ